MNTITDFWNSFPLALRDNVTRIALALLVFALFWLLRRLLAALVVRPLHSLAKRSNAGWDDVILDIVTVPTRLIIIALGLILGAEILNVDLTTSVFVIHLARMLIIIAVLMATYQIVDALAPSSPRLFRLTGLKWRFLFPATFPTNRDHIEIGLVFPIRLISRSSVTTMPFDS